MKLTRKLETENSKLREIIKRRTVELEQKNRELEIETALEKVRAVAMAMKKADDMLSICKTISKQLAKLGVKEIRNVQTAIFYESRQVYMNYEFYAKHDKTFITETSYTNHRIHNAFAMKMLKGSGQFYKTHIKGKKVKDWIAYQKTTNVFIDKYLNTASSLNYYWHSLGPVALGISTYAPLTKESSELFLRFLKVFELAYRRYLDIEKAEAQAREAQIEAALERVRSRSIAMHRSEEIAEIVGKIFSELRQLNLVLNRVLIWTFNDPEKYITWWSANPEAESSAESYRIDYNDQPVFINFLKAWQQKQPVYLQTLSGDAKRKWEEHLFENTDMSKLPLAVRKGMREEGTIYTTSVISDYGLMMVGSFELLSKENIDITQRFGRVFQQSYTRYLDVQKAEAQAREAQIEAALERVRSQAMAMRQSADLLDIVVTMRNEFTKLGHEAHYFWYMRWLPDKYEKAMTSGDGTRIGMIMELPRHMHGDIPLLANWEKSDEPAVVYAMDVEAAINYVDKMVALGDFKQVDHNAPTTDDIRHINGLTFIMARTLHGEIGYSLPGVVPHPPADDIKTLVRFAGVFDLAYRRFEDLKLAEQKNRETEIELALERTRTQSMLMQRSDELDETLRVFHQQVLQLGIPSAFSFLWLPDEEKDRHVFWAVWVEKNSTVFKSKAINYLLDRNEPATVQCLVDWKSKQVVSYQVPAEGVESYFGAWSELIEGAEHLKPEYFKEGLYYVEAFIKYGCFGVLVKNDLAEDEKKILYRFAVEFERTYTRFLDLQKAEAQAMQAEQDLIAIKEAKQKAEEALTELQATQKQLIQAEKMASLGELTAGIAHEIQNPLNFVNNFSEVNTELIEEMKEELKTGNTDDAINLADDIKANNEKITFHGKRADSIVKGMLQHSRSGSNQKEATNINNLLDECLRLSFHGMRAKDKSFNAKTETEFDSSIAPVSIVSQEIGRVFLNLFTNAFYSVMQKKKTMGENFSPVVSASTQKEENKVKIIVRDNGNGIPQKVLDKIFQPFFTTKPTGEGTGLGLSMSYDIITKGHGGEIKVETKEGEFAEFTIILPV